jgi:hypothetical protein
MWGWIMRMVAFNRPSVDQEINAKPVIAQPGKPRLLTTDEMVKYFGNPGDAHNMITMPLPYKMRIAWDLSKTTDKVLVHKKVAPALMRVLIDLRAHYGYEKLVELGIDLFGGLYNYRPQRGLEKKYEAAMKAGNNALAQTYLSRHSWATSIDIFPSLNGLKTKWKDAQFSKPEYKPLLDIFEKHGFVNYGVLRGSDAMHFEYGIAA